MSQAQNLPPQLLRIYNYSRQCPIVSYTLIPTGAKLAHFDLLEEISQDSEIVDSRV